MFVFKIISAFAQELGKNVQEDLPGASFRTGHRKVPVSVFMQVRSAVCARLKCTLFHLTMLGVLE